LGEDKFKYARLAKQKCFGLTFFANLLKLVKGATKQTLTRVRKECNDQCCVGVKKS
jgi:hypothetical protein